MDSFKLLAYQWIGSFKLLKNVLVLMFLDSHQS